VPVDLTFAQQQVISTILMDRCKIERTDDPRDNGFDDATGLLEETTPTLLVTDLPCSAREHEALERTAIVGASPKGIKQFTVNLPAAWDDVQPGDVITFTTSSDPRLQDVPLNVQGVRAGTLRALRRVQCEVEESRLGVHPG
jgi:hypothetical protein